MPESGLVNREDQKRVNRAVEVAGILFLGFLTWSLFLSNPTPSPTPVPTETPSPTVTLAATSTSTRPITKTLPTPTPRVEGIYNHDLSLWEIDAPCCLANQTEAIVRGDLGLSVTLRLTRAFRIGDQRGVAGDNLQLSREGQSYRVSFGQVVLCGLARFGERGPLVFCPEGKSFQPFKMALLDKKSSVGLEPALAEQLMKSGVNKYNGRIVVFNEEDLP